MERFVNCLRPPPTTTQPTPTMENRPFRREFFSEPYCGMVKEDFTTNCVYSKCSETNGEFKDAPETWNPPPPTPLRTPMCVLECSTVFHLS